MELISNLPTTTTTTFPCSLNYLNYFSFLKFFFVLFLNLLMAHTRNTTLCFFIIHRCKRQKTCNFIAWYLTIIPKSVSMVGQFKWEHICRLVCRKIVPESYVVEVQCVVDVFLFWFSVGHLYFQQHVVINMVILRWQGHTVCICTLSIRIDLKQWKTKKIWVGDVDFINFKVMAKIILG